MTQEEILYNYFLKSQTERYETAALLLKTGMFKELCRDFIHYVITDRKEKEIACGSIENTVNALLEVKKSLPNNAGVPKVVADVDEHGAGIILVMWNEYRLPKKETPEILSRNYTRDAVFKLKHQPNGKDAKRYQKIIENAGEKL